MNRRRALMSVVSSSPAPRLPVEYQEVEWVGATGTPTQAKTRIDTGYVPKSQNVKFVTDWLVTGTASTTAFGFMYGDVPRCILSSYNKWLYWRFGSDTYSTRFQFEANEWNHISCGKDMYFNGTKKGTVNTYDLSGNTRSVYLFSGDAATKSNSKYKVFYIYEGDTVVRTLVPCYRKSDGRIGFYDMESNVFRYNEGGASSDLVKGADVN